jgi:hypothetical protein
MIFVAGATQAQRQAAIDLVGGLVVGGRRRDPDEGRYYIRIEYDAAGHNLCDALDALVALPQVEIASPIQYAKPAYRQPNDDAAMPTI